MNFEINLIFLIKPFCYTTKKVKTKSKISYNFFLKPHHQNPAAPLPMGCCPPPPSPLKNKAPHLKNQFPHWKVKPPSRKWLLEKSLKKSATVINTCVSIIKQHQKKMAEISQECDFLTWNVQNFVTNQIDIWLSKESYPVSLDRLFSRTTPDNMLQ